MSAYEFEFLKSEEETQKLLKPCTIYFIVQRPLLYFENLKCYEGVVSFDITDGTKTAPLKCEFAPSMNGFCEPDEEIEMQIEFYKKTPDEVEPFNDVAAFKFRTLEGKYLGWFSPNLFLYRYLDETLSAKVDGLVSSYLDYEVHYIGKAFSQDIWKRLTGHEKMQSILTLEDSLNSKSLKAPFEISLVMLDIDGFDEANIQFQFDAFVEKGIEPIIHRFTFEEEDSRYEEYQAPKLGPRDVQLTNEVEAMLISMFRPKYNEILFEKYPYINSGTRAAGYTQSTLLIEKFPATLRTKNHTQALVLPQRVR